MKRIVCIFLLVCFFNSSAFAVEFDSSIDEQIRKTYNIEESTLPPLPTSEADTPVQIQTTKYNPIGSSFTIVRGTKINLQLTKAIYDRTAKGSKISFIASQGLVTKEGQIIPAGTIFKGTVTDSHPAQMTGNGGLIELKIDEIYFNGIMSKIDTKVSLANSKKVFLGNIKGKRSYWSNFSKVMTPGKKVFRATQTCASVMSAIPVVNILSFVPLLGGAVVYTVNFAAAPFITIFTKGKSLTLPAGSIFQIKITKDSVIRG